MISTMKVTTSEVRDVVAILDDIIDDYKEKTKSKKRDWRTYEQRVAARLRKAFHELKPLVEEAVSSLHVAKGELRGAPQKLTLEQKVLALLLKHLLGKSNRNMTHMLIIFSWLTDIDVSYKTIERLYSDQEVQLALHNLHFLILKKKGIKQVDCGGDGTGYGLTVKKHYATEAQKLKEKMKTSKGQKRPGKKALFVYSFMLLDLRTRLYVGFGTSMKSEKQAFLAALNMAKEADITIESIRLDRYFSCQAYVELLREEFGEITLYLIPKTNATVKGPWVWKRMLYRFVNDPVSYLEEYFQRNQSESCFAEDKRRTGWQLGQKRPDRINTANICTGLWHNLYWLSD